MDAVEQCRVSALSNWCSRIRCRGSTVMTFCFGDSGLMRNRCHNCSRHLRCGIWSSVIGANTVEPNKADSIPKRQPNAAEAQECQSSRLVSAVVSCPGIPVCRHCGGRLRVAKSGDGSELFPRPQGVEGAAFGRYFRSKLVPDEFPFGDGNRRGCTRFTRSGDVATRGSIHSK